MSKMTYTYKGEQMVACSCDCHQVGVCVRHIVPCCDLTYEPYIRVVEGKLVLDEILLDKALEHTYNWMQEQKLKKQQEK